MVHSLHNGSMVAAQYLQRERSELYIVTALVHLFCQVSNTSSSSFGKTLKFYVEKTSGKSPRKGIKNEKKN